MNDDLSKKYIKQGSHLSKQFTKQKTKQFLGDDNDLSGKLNARRDESNSNYEKTRNESHYNVEDVINTNAVQNNEIIRYQSTSLMNENDNGNINLSAANLNASERVDGNALGASNMNLNLDDQVTAYRQ